MKSAETDAMLGPSFRRLMKLVLDWPRTAACRHIAHAFDADGDTELSRLRCTRQSAYLAAAMAVAEKSPEIFGKQTSPTALTAAISKAVTERNNLYSEIETSWQRSDVSVMPVSENDRASGLGRLGFIVLGDGRAIGERLVGWYLDTAAQKEAA